MTCRVARLFQSSHPRIESVACCKCGSTHLGKLLTSQALGPHLCSMCSWSGVDYEALSDDFARSPMRGRLVA
jgi:hypothetical protein